MWVSLSRCVSLVQDYIFFACLLSNSLFALYKMWDFRSMALPPQSYLWCSVSWRFLTLLLTFRLRYSLPNFIFVPVCLEKKLSATIHISGRLKKYPFCINKLFCFWRVLISCQAMSLSRATDHKAGRMLAYKLMCLMTVRRHDKDLSSEHLTHFYRLLHVGLSGSDQVCASVYLIVLKYTLFNAFYIVVGDLYIAIIYKRFESLGA